MQDLDRMIEEALDEEERELLARIGGEPGFIEQMFGVFGGNTGWVNGYLLLVQMAFFLAGVWTGWMFFAATDPVVQLRWGLPSVALLLMALMIKMAIWPSVQANRMMRELKLIQLQLARKAGQSGRSKESAA